MNYGERLRYTMLIVLMPIISYVILGPLEIYFGNEKDFAFSYGDFFWLLLLIAIAVWAIGSLLVAALPEKLCVITNAVILGIAIASYIQNMFMNVKLSEADGSPMNWNELKSFTTINLIIWIVILALVICGSVFLKKYWTKISMGAAAFFSLIQIVAVISLVLPAITEHKESGNLQMATDERFQVAKENNIIIFVLDTFGNTQYEEALKKYPEIAEDLSDFTFYNNADCHYYCTFPSMTHMLTGNEFDFNATSEGWMQTAWTSERAVNFYQTLHDDEYTVNLYSATPGYVYGDLENLYGKIDNVRGVDTIVKKGILVKRICKMSIYKYVPYIVKPYFEVLSKEFDSVVEYAEGDSCTDDNGEFYQLLLNNPLEISNDMKNAVIIQHIFGTHQPYTLNQNAEIVEEADRIDTIKGLSVILNEYMQQLKDIGMYDDATIIITADHGAWYGGDTQPIFFIKQSGETHEALVVNEAPISLDDMQATILSLAGEDYSAYGTSIFDWNVDDVRERTVYMRENDEQYPEVQGSSFNVYYQYTYVGKRNNLNERVEQGPDDIVPATPWIDK